LHLIPAVAHADSSRLALGLGAGLRVAQLAELRAAAEVPALFRHEVDSGGVRETAERPAILVTLLDVGAGAIREPSLLPVAHISLLLLPVDQVAPADRQAVLLRSFSSE